MAEINPKDIKPFLVVPPEWVPYALAVWGTAVTVVEQKELPTDG